MLLWSLLMVVACSTEHTLIITPAQVQAKVDEKFPLTRGMDNVLSITLSDPQVRFPGEARLATTLAVAATWPDLSAVTPPPTAVDADASPEARAHDLLRRLTDAAVQVAAAPLHSSTGTLDLSGELRYVPQDGAFYLAQTQLDAFHLEDLPDEHAETARSVGSSAVAMVLDQLPVYTLGDDLKGEAARLLLKDVRAEPDGLHVTLGR